VRPDAIGRQVAAEQLAVEGEAQIEDHREVRPDGAANTESRARLDPAGRRLGHRVIVPRRAAPRR
jgi:hypothetical protein